MNEVFPAPEVPTIAKHPRRALELAPHLLDLGLAAEEVLGVGLGEGGEAGVGVEVLGALDAEGHVFECSGQGVGGVVSALAVLGHGLLDDLSPRRVGELAGSSARPPTRSGGTRSS